MNDLNNKPFFSFTSKYVIGILILILVSIIIYYKYDQKWFTTNTSFAKNNNLESDSLGNGLISPADTLALDSIPITNNESEFFNLNTNYSSIAIEPLIPTNEIIKEAGLFDKLLLINENGEYPADILNLNIDADVLSFKSVLKIVSVISRNILLNENTIENRVILQDLASSKNILEISIVDLEGQIITSTNLKNLNTFIQHSFPSIDLSNIKLEVSELDNVKLIILPLFHTYGKVGSAILKCIQEEPLNDIK